MIIFWVAKFTGRHFWYCNLRPWQGLHTHIESGYYVLGLTISFINKNKYSYGDKRHFHLQKTTGNSSVASLNSSCTSYTTYNIILYICFCNCILISILNILINPNKDNLTKNLTTSWSMITYAMFQSITFTGSLCYHKSLMKTVKMQKDESLTK